MIDIEIEDAAWSAALPEVETLARRAAEAALAAADFDPREPDLTLLLTDDAAVRDLNARFRGKDAATNVLSFPAPDSARPHLGDVALAYGVCAREAVDQGKRLDHHLMHLVAHGVLHLVGYDHQIDSEAETMESLERQILERLGAPDPYDADATRRHGF